MQHYGALMLSIAGEKDAEGTSLLHSVALSNHDDSAAAVLLPADPTADIAPGSSGMHASDEGTSTSLDLKRLRKRRSDVTGTVSAFTKPLTSSTESRSVAASDMDVILRRFEQLMSDMESTCPTNEGAVTSLSGSMFKCRTELKSSDAEISNSVPHPNPSFLKRGFLELR